MAIRTNLLNGNVINKDSDFSKYIETVSEPGVIEGLSVSTSEVAVGKAWVPCLRSNGEKLYALVNITSAVSISGEGDVYIEVKQSMIDDGELANDDGTGIAEVKVGTIPENNALLLATIDDGVVEDKRNMIKKVGELYTAIQTLGGRLGTVEDTVESLVNEGSSALKEMGIVGENYSISNKLFRQKTPKFSNSTLSRNVGDVASNTQIHIQRLGSGTASNKLNISAKKIGAPTTGLVVEVRRGVKVDVNSAEAYWYGGDLICSGSIPYSSITADFTGIEVTLNGQFGGTKGELLDVVVYQTGNIVNSTNYYAIACDSSQYSEGFSLVAVNGNTRSRSKYMPYCIGTGFLDNMLCKTVTAGSSASDSVPFSVTSDSSISGSQHTTTVTYTVPQSYDTLYVIISYNVPVGLAYGGEGGSIVLKSGNTTVGTISNITKGTTSSQTFKLTNVSSSTVLSAVVTSTTGTGQGGSYAELTLSGNMVISATQSGIIKPLIPVEEKAIGQETYGISYGRLDDGSWYGEFDGDVHNSATTGSISLGNCIGFKVITDSNGEQYKIPIYGM